MSRQGWRQRAGNTRGLAGRTQRPPRPGVSAAVSFGGWGWGEGEPAIYFAHGWNLKYSFKLLRILECHKLLKTACQDHKDAWRKALFKPSVRNERRAV